MTILLELLKIARNFSFEQVEEKIYSGDFITVKHHQKECNNQSIILVKIDCYINALPCLISDKEIFLKTIYESRKKYYQLSCCILMIFPSVTFTKIVYSRFFES